MVHRPLGVNRVGRTFRPRRLQPPAPRRYTVAMGTVLGRYNLVRKLAVGGMGEVWLARTAPRPGVPEAVVVKKLLSHLKSDEEFVNMFFDEARIASVLEHPNIARIYDLGDEDGEYFIAMEFVHGMPLSELMVRAAEAGQSVPAALACRIVADAAGALDFAHHARSPSGAPLDLIHRDVSPQNILVSFEGEVKLIDFGVAKAANKLTRTATGIIKGKYAYMSPEQAYDEDLDARSDLFGLGVVLWETLCAGRLFKKKTDTETLQAVVDQEIVPPSKIDRRIPKALDALVLKALQREREARFQRGDELKAALDAFLKRQRLPATAVHLAAWVKELCPLESRLPPELEEETDPSADRLTVPKRGKKLETTVLDPAELELRIKGTAEGDTLRGTLFNALIAAVIRSVGPASESQVRKAALDMRQYVDSLDYATSDFLRMLWKSVELLAPKCRSVDAAFEQLGRYTMDALLRSPFGKDLEAIGKTGPSGLFRPLVGVLNDMVRPGTRAVAESEPGRVRLVFKDDVLPIQLYMGLIASLVHTLHGATLEASWDRPAAQRVELELTWR